MKMLYIVPEPFPDRRARFIQIINTCDALAGAGAEVILITGLRKGYTAESALKYYGIVAKPGLKIVRLPMLRKGDNSFFRFSWHGIFHYALLNHLMSYKMDIEKQTVLFTRHLKLAGFLLRYRNLLRHPLIFEAHEIFSRSGETKSMNTIGRLEERVYRLSDALVFISGKLEDDLKASIPGAREKPCTVTHDGVRKEWLGVRREGKKRYICYIGSLYKWKGIDVLISAMQYLPEETLLVVGGGNRLTELQKGAEAKGITNVIFTGEIQHSSVPDYLAQAKIAILPNIECGPSVFSSPLKLFEYMASGLPIVASDLPVFREILSHKKNSILVEPGNPQALASGINFLIQNPAVASDIAAQANADIENFTYERRAERILDLIRRLCR